MPKKRENKKYSGEFKKTVIETMREEDLGIHETARRFGLRHKRIQDWDRIYLEEGAEGLLKERRGRASATVGTRKGRPPKLNRQVEEDLIAENQRLRAENDYLKNLHALVQERERREKKRK